MEVLQQQMTELLSRTARIISIEHKLSLLDEKIDSKISSLDTKISALDSKINLKINIIDKKIDSLTTKYDSQIDGLEHDVAEIKDSAEFISKQYENQKKTSETLLKRDTTRENDIKILTDTVKDLQNKLDQETCARNQVAQYHRSSLNVLIGGIPIHTGDDSFDPSNAATKDLVAKVATAANFTYFSASDIDVCHRLPTKNTNAVPTIIVRFKTKQARMSFYHQRKKVRNISVSDLNRSTDELLRRRNNRDHDQGETDYGEKIYINESLTKLNGDLLRAAKLRAKPLNYKYHGYTVGGEVCVKKADSGPYISIRSQSDLNNIQ